MHEVTENLALALKLKYASVRGDAGTIHFRPVGKTFAMDHWPKGGAYNQILVSSELAVYEWLRDNAPWAFDELRRSEWLYDRGLALRAELLLSHGPALDARLVRFEAEPRIMWDLLVTSLDATRQAKSRAKLRRVKPSAGSSAFELRERVLLPHYAGPTPVLMALEVFPSPVDDHAWSMHVMLPAQNREVVRRNQAAIRETIGNLAARGITIEDVLQGTNLSV